MIASSREIRSSFLEFFKSNGHSVVASSPLVPGNDPTLLFTNSGMVQFKDVFLGAESRSYVRAASAQRCLRAGGKHNDLDQVGYTARHHTFFEMLGNFSFGDYFKRDAIDFAWRYLTDTLKLDPNKLWVTVYHTDDEAFALWRDLIGVPAERIVRIGDNKGAPYASDNFWQMADTGPCGPCSEIFYDHGPDVAGGPPGSADADGDRYIEIWNLVFMQFDRAPDGTLAKLPKPCVDTGMGLERLAAILQGAHSNYQIDVFRALIGAALRLTGANDSSDPSLKVIADHIRACAFLIVDGVLPSNEGRGYVLRRIIRRAARHGYKLGQASPFFHAMVEPLVAEMGDAYPELARRAATVSEVLKQEEERFAETLSAGMKIFEGIVGTLPAGGEIGGADAFRLYDTYGFPVDLTEDVARERHLTVDTAGFEIAMDAQRDRARAASGFGGGETVSAEQIAKMPATVFVGYDTLELNDARIVGLIRHGAALDSADAPSELTVVLDRTPFYAESGGQVGDHGQLHADGVAAQVLDTVKLTSQHIGHQIKLSEGRLRVGMTLGARVDHERRDRAESFGHSPASRSAAPCARRSRAAKRLARRA
jgi:alanyl-tRNA synthetase